MLTADEVEAYRRDGFVLARAVLDPDDVALLVAETKRAWERAGTGQHTQNSRFEGVKKISAIRDPQLHSAVFTRYLTDPRLTERMSQLVGPDVQLHHSKINVKTTSDEAIFPLHQDYPYFPHAEHSVCTVLVHLSDTDGRRGCFRVVPGVKAPLPHDNVAAEHLLPLSEYPLDSAVEVPAKAGDVIFMNYLTPHGSDLNLEPEPRVLWIIQVRAPTDRPLAQPPDASQPVPAGGRPAQGTMLRGSNPDYRRAASGESSWL